MNELLDVKKVAGILGVSQRTVWRLADSGRMIRPLALSGNLRRWNRAALEAWIADGCPPVRNSKGAA
jgi:excisionase family DNA binding protein